MCEPNTGDDGYEQDGILRSTCLEANAIAEGDGTLLKTTNNLPFQK